MLRMLQLEYGSLRREGQADNFLSIARITFGSQYWMINTKENLSIENIKLKAIVATSV